MKSASSVGVQGGREVLTTWIRQISRKFTANRLTPRGSGWATVPAIAETRAEILRLYKEPLGVPGG